MRKLLTNLLLAAFSVAVAFALVEVGLRIAGIGFPPLHKFDGRLGSVLNPGMEGWFRTEGRSWVKVNSDGMRDREHSIEKPAGTYRIAVLGDSMAEALQVPMERDFCAVLEKRLRGCARLGGKTPETLNFGVSGYGTAEELIMLRERVWKYHPDMVLLAMFPGNDIRNNNAALNHDPGWPYISLVNGQLVTRYPPAQDPGALRRFRDSMLNHSNALQLIYHVRQTIHTRGTDQMVGPGKDPRTAGEQGVDDATFGPPETADWRQAWQVTEALLIAMRDEVCAHKAEFAVALIPSGIQDYPEPAVREAYAKRIGGDLSYAHKRLEDFLRREGVFTIPLETPLRQYAEAHHAMLHGFSNSAMGFGHLNETGHQVAGETLAEEICARQ